MAGYLGAIPVPQATQHRESFTATAGQTTFNTAGYTVGFLDVYLNGVHLTPADVTATNGSDVVLGACLVNDIVDVISYSAFELNSQTFTGTTTMSTTDNSNNLILTSTDADATVGPIMKMYRASGSGADNDAIGEINFNFNNDAQEETIGTRIRNFIIDASNGTEDAAFDIFSMKAGALTSIINYDGTTLSFNDGSADLDFRVESNGNANMLFVDGGNDKVGIGTNAPEEQFSVQDASGGIVFLGRTSGTTTGLLGRIEMGNTDVDSALGGIDFTQDGATNSSRIGFFTQAAGAAAAERMRIHSSGNVGIGPSAQDIQFLPASTNSGLNKVYLRGNATDEKSTITLNHFGVRSFDISAGVIGSGLFHIGQNASDPAFVINGSGNLLVGTTGNIGTAARLTLLNVNTGLAGISVGNAGGSGNTNVMVMSNSNGIVGTIRTNGSATAYNTSSDYRLKTDAQPMTGASDRVLALKPVNFEWLSDGSRVDGFIAHEAQAVVPEAVTGTKDAMMDEEYHVSAATGDIYTPSTDEADEVIHSKNVEQPEKLADGQQWRETTPAVMGTRSVPDMQGIDQSKIVPLLVAALQEALARITALENA